MFKKFKIWMLALGLVGVMSLLPSAVALAADPPTPADSACDGIKILDPDAKCKNPSEGKKGFNSIVNTIINIFSVVVGAVSVIMIIIGGFRYVISGGDSSATKSAKDTIMYAVIGLVVVLFAQVIVLFVISNTDETAKTPATPATPTAPATPTTPPKATP